MYSWGRNAFGQLGLGPGKGTEVSVPTQIVFPSSIREIAASDDSSYAIDHDGYLWAWGSNQLLQVEGISINFNCINPFTVEFGYHIIEGIREKASL